MLAFPTDPFLVVTITTPLAPIQKRGKRIKDFEKHLHLRTKCETEN